MRGIRFRKSTVYAGLLLAPAILVLVALLIIPLAWIVRVSFNEAVPGGSMIAAFTLENYMRFLGDTWYIQNVLLWTVWIAVGSTFITVVLAYPLALFISGAQGALRRILLTLVLSPLLIGIVSLVFGWIVLFRSGGLLNQLSMAIGVIREPIRYMYSTNGVVILLVYVGVPFIVLSLLDSMGRISSSLYEAATNAGANRWQTFLHVTLPLSAQGAFSGSIIVFALNFSAFSVALMVGSERTTMIGLVVYNQAVSDGNQPFASAIAIVMVAASALLIMGYSYLANRFIFRHMRARS